VKKKEKARERGLTIPSTNKTEGKEIRGIGRK
jgi:hypothetical protein